MKYFVLNPANLRTILFGFHREGLCTKKMHEKNHLQDLVKLARFSCKSSPPQIITLRVARQIASYNFHSILTKILTAFIPTLLREVKLDFTSKQHLLKQKCYK